MLVGVAIVFGKLVALPPAPHHDMVPVVKTNPRAGVTAVLDIVFTYGGQVWLIPYCAVGLLPSDSRPCGEATHAWCANAAKQPPPNCGTDSS